MKVLRSLLWTRHKSKLRVTFLGYKLGYALDLCLNKHGKSSHLHP